MNFKSPRSSGVSLIVVAVLSAGSCFYVFKAATVRLIAQSDVRVTPYTLQREIYYYKENPSGELRQKETIARRSDGATATLTSVGPLAKGVYSRGITFLDGSSVGLADFVKSKTTFPASEAQAAVWRARMLNPSRNCAFPGDTVVVEGATLLDQKVAVVKRRTSFGPVITAWRAPDLGCEQLQYRVEDPQPDGSYKLVTEDKGVSLKLIEPDPALFDEGRDYAELRPSVLASRVHAWLGVASDSEDVLGPLANADRNYDQRWAAH